MDSGMYMISIAEYFVLNKEFPKDSCYDLEFIGQVLGFSVFSYGLEKQDFDYDSEIDYIDDGNENPKDYVQNVKLNKKKLTKSGQPKKKIAEGSKKNKKSENIIEIL